MPPTPHKSRIVLVITLASMASSAFFVAQGSMQLVASAILPSDAPDEAPRGRRRPSDAPAAPSRREVDPTAILRRNIFDHTVGDLTRSPEADPDPSAATTEGEAAPADPNAAPPPCDGAVRLVAAIYNDGQPDLSFAAITDAAGKAMLYRRGSRVGEREVVDIYPSRVHLRPAAGSLCHIAMFSPAGAERPPAAVLGASAVAPPTPVEPVTPPPTTGGIATAELEAGIQQSSETSYTIQRSLVNRLLDNQAELMRTARIIPHEENGRVVGVKLYGIRRNSLLGRLGLQNGDLLRTINGFDMSSPDKALEAYARLREAPRLTVAVDRRGSPLTVDYNIQ